MADTLKLTILSPERRLVDGVDVDHVTFTGSEGQIQILPGHAPMVGTLTTGTFAYRQTGVADQRSGVISSGFFEVDGEQVRLLSETVELKGEIDLQRAIAAQEKAEYALADSAITEQNFKKYQLKLQRALIRQHVASKAD